MGIQSTLNMRQVLGTFLNLLTLVSAQGNTTIACDRQCLETVLSNYLTALVSHDHKSLPTTPDVKYVENDQIVPIGTGEWLVASAPGKYRHVFADPPAGQVGAITTLLENNTPVIYVVRLKVESPVGKYANSSNHLISEIETQITRDTNGALVYENITSLEPAWFASVPAGQRLSRAALIAQTNKYYSGMERNDPHGNYSFFADDCNRWEDGTKSTNLSPDNATAYGHSNDTTFATLGCAAQFQTGFLGFVTRIRDRRFPIVDEERQVVVAVTTLDHNGTVRTLPDVGGRDEPIPSYFDVPRSLLATEAFKLRDGKLWKIEMTLTEVPYGMRSAFDGGLGTVGELIGKGNNLTLSTNTSSSSGCDRSCLLSAINQTMHAFLTNSPNSLPLASGIRYSENGQFLTPGDGLWETLAHFSIPQTDPYAAFFADPDSLTAAYWGLIREHNTTGVLAVGITVTPDNRIATIEALAVRAEAPGARGGTMTLMRPPLPIEWDGTASSLGALDPVFFQDGGPLQPVFAPLRGDVDVYYDGLQMHDAWGLPIADECMRRDNGVAHNLSCAMQMYGNGPAPSGVGNFTTTVRDRRWLVTDPLKGVVVAVAMADVPATASAGGGSAGQVPGGAHGVGAAVDATDRVPSTYMMLGLFKISMAEITKIEGMVKWMPYGYTSAWSELPQPQY